MEHGYGLDIVAMEVGIEPMVRHATDLGYLPVVVDDACGAGNAAAAERSVAALRYTGGTLFTDLATFDATLRRNSISTARRTAGTSRGT